MTFDGLDYYRPRDACQEAVAELEYSDGQGGSGRLTPSIILYRDSDGPHVEIDYSPGLREDLYAVLAGYSQETGSASFKLLVNPMVTWLWIGTVVLIAGAVMVAIPMRSSAPAPTRSYCSSCGRPVDASAHFCSNCGARQEDLPQ